MIKIRVKTSELMSCLKQFTKKSIFNPRAPLVIDFNDYNCDKITFSMVIKTGEVMNINMKYKPLFYSADEMISCAVSITNLIKRIDKKSSETELYFAVSTIYPSPTTTNDLKGVNMVQITNDGDGVY